jgi:hypothetical protein
MATKNDVTGDEIRTGGNSNAYKDNWDAIFKKKPVANADDNLLCSDCGLPLESGHRISCSKLKL